MASAERDACQRCCERRRERPVPGLEHLTFPSVKAARNIARISNLHEAYARLTMPRNNRPETPRTGRFAKQQTVRQAVPRHAARLPLQAAASKYESSVANGAVASCISHHRQACGRLRTESGRPCSTGCSSNWPARVAWTCSPAVARSGSRRCRGAPREVVFVERDAVSARAIRDMLGQLRCDRGRVEQVRCVGVARAWPARLETLRHRVPRSALRRGVAARLAEKLERGGWLAPGAWIYLEDAAARGEPPLPRWLDAVTQQARGRRRLSSRPPGRRRPRNNENQARGSE